MATQPTQVYNAGFSTSSGTGGPRMNIDYRMQLIKQRETAAPFLSLMLHINSEPTKTSTFKTFETRPNPKKGTINGTVVAAGAVATAISIVLVTPQAARFNVGDIVRAKTATAADSTYTVEGRVTANNGTTTLTVYPNDPALIMSGVTDGDELQVWSRSHAQGTTSANPNGQVPTLRTFYTQIFKHSYQVNATQANNRLYGAPERDRLRGETEIEHLIEIEKALLYGTGTSDTSTDTDPRTTLTGLLNQFTSNVVSYGAELSSRTLFDTMTAVHAAKYAPDGKMSKRMVLASADVMNYIGRIAEAKRQTLDVVTQYGVDISRMVWPGRTWDFIEDPILSDFLPGYAIVFHPRYVKLREFRPTRLQANVQANDADYFKDQFLTELGLETQLEELGAVLHH